jgi:hypothetical protein
MRVLTIRTTEKPREILNSENFITKHQKAAIITSDVSILSLISTKSNTVSTLEREQESVPFSFAYS